MRIIEVILSNRVRRKPKVRKKPGREENPIAMYPRARAMIDQSNLLFIWRLNKQFMKMKKIKNVKYVVSFYKQPTAGGKRGQKEKPIIQANVGNLTLFKFRRSKILFKSKRTYSWQVKAFASSNKLIVASPRQEFRYREGAGVPELSLAAGGVMMGRLPEFRPHAPFVWGSPVRARPRGRPGGSTPDEEPSGGTTSP